MSTRYPVHSIRSTFIDQGSLLGVPAISVVLCSGHVRQQVDTPEELRHGSPEFCLMSAREIAEEIARTDGCGEWVVIEGPSTGSCSLEPLVTELHEFGAFLVNIRANSSAHGAIGAGCDWLTLFYGARSYPRLILEANEHIFQILNGSDIEDVKETIWLYPTSEDAQICVEPMSPSMEGPTRLACIMYGWRLARTDERLW